MNGGENGAESGESILELASSAAFGTESASKLAKAKSAKAHVKSHQ
jgi:hypothetical protein